MPKVPVIECVGPAGRVMYPINAIPSGCTPVDPSQLARLRRPPLATTPTLAPQVEDPAEPEDEEAYPEEG